MMQIQLWINIAYGLELSHQYQYTILNHDITVHMIVTNI